MQPVRSIRGLTGTSSPRSERAAFDVGTKLDTLSACDGRRAITDPGIDAEGKVVIRRRLKRRYVLAFFQKLAPCLVGIEVLITIERRVSRTALPFPRWRLPGGSRGPAFRSCCR